jgi:hypothetical protein
VFTHAKVALRTKLLTTQKELERYLIEGEINTQVYCYQIDVDSIFVQTICLNIKEQSYM